VTGGPPNGTDIHRREYKHVSGAVSVLGPAGSAWRIVRG
jgi:hypothetical protein